MNTVVSFTLSSDSVSAQRLSKAVEQLASALLDRDPTLRVVAKPIRGVVVLVDLDQQRIYLPGVPEELPPRLNLLAYSIYTAPERTLGLSAIQELMGVGPEAVRAMVYRIRKALPFEIIETRDEGYQASPFTHVITIERNRDADQ